MFWIWVPLLLSLVDSVRLTEEAYATFEEHTPTFGEVVQAGANIEANLTCDNLGEKMAEAVSRSRYALDELFAQQEGQALNDTMNDTINETTKSDIVIATGLVLEYAAVADKRKCVVGTMLSDGVQSEIESLLSAHLENVLHVPGKEEDTARLTEAFTRLVSWQRGTLDMAGPDLLREVVFDRDLENSCPQECMSCTHKHNSWSKGEEIFKFKCLLKDKKSPIPEQPGLQCEKPRRRWKQLFKPPHFKSWCRVQHWKDAACRQMRVSMMMNCGAASVTHALAENPANPPISVPQQVHKDCILYEVGVATHKKGPWPENPAPPLVPKRNAVGVGVILALGLANGLASLRDASLAEPNNISMDLLKPFLDRSGWQDGLRKIYNGTDLSEGRCDFILDKVEECKPDWKQLMLNSGVRLGNFVWVLLLYVLFAVSVLVTMAWSVFALLLMLLAAATVSIWWVNLLIWMPAIFGVGMSTWIGFKIAGNKPDALPCRDDYDWGKMNWKELLDDLKEDGKKLLPA